MQISDRLIFLRERKGCSQQYIADLLGISKSLYCKYERSNRTPDLAKLKILADFYEVELRSLILLPIKNTVVYSDGLLDKLNNTINEHGIIGSNVAETRNHYEKLRNVWREVINERLQAMDFPDLGIDISEYVGETIQTVTLDLRGEILIENANKIVMNQLEYLTSNTSKKNE